MTLALVPFICRYKYIAKCIYLRVSFFVFTVDLDITLVCIIWQFILVVD